MPISSSIVNWTTMADKDKRVIPIQHASMIRRLSRRTCQYEISRGLTLDQNVGPMRNSASREGVSTSSFTWTGTAGRIIKDLSLDGVCIRYTGRSPDNGNAT